MGEDIHTLVERSRGKNTSDISLPCFNSPSTILEVVISDLTYIVNAHMDKRGLGENGLYTFNTWMYMMQICR